MAHRHDDPTPRWGGPGWGPRPGWVPPWAGPPPWGSQAAPPQGGTPSDLRIGNAERTEVTNALVRHLAEGRLTEEELEERMATAQAAKTADDLRPLLADLPPFDGEGGVAGSPPPPPRPPRWRGRPILLWLLVAFVAVSFVGWAGHAARWGWGAPWFHVPWIPILIVGFFLVRRARHRR